MSSSVCETTAPVVNMFEFMQLKSSVIDYNKRQELFVFFLKDVRISCTTQKKINYSRLLDFAILMVFHSEMPQTSCTSVYDEEIFDSELFKKACSIPIQQVPVIFALQKSSSVRKQNHSVLCQQIVISFKNNSDFAVVKSAKCNMALIHADTPRESLQLCLLQEQEMREFFQVKKYLKNKRKKKKY